MNRQYTTSNKAPNHIKKSSRDAINLLAVQSIYALWAELCVATAFFITLLDITNSQLLIIWYCAFIIILLSIYYTRHAYFKTKKNKNIIDADAWEKLFTWVFFVNGLCWGIAVLFLIPIENHVLIYQDVVIMILLGVCAGGSSFLWPVRQAHAAFLLPTIIPLTLWLIGRGGTYSYLGAGSIIFILAMLLAAFNSYKYFNEAIQIFHRYIKLTKSLSEAKTTLVKQSLSLKKNIALLNATLDASIDGILVINRGDLIVNYNQRFLDLWHLQDSEVKNSSLAKLIKSISPLLMNQELFEKVLRKNVEVNPKDFDLIHLLDGKIFEISSQFQTVGTKLVGKVYFFRDVTHQKNLEKELFYQATHDPLTRLPNRNLLHDRLQQLISNSLRTKDSFAVAFIDVDKFKPVNDTIGHAAGDILLKKIAETLSKNTRKSDTLARIGGDEFVVVMTNIDSKEDILIILNKLFDAFKEPFNLNGQNIYLTLSVGVSFYPRDGKDILTLVNNADTAMYQAKESGGNCYQLFSEENGN